MPSYLIFVPTHCFSLFSVLSAVKLFFFSAQECSEDITAKYDNDLLLYTHIVLHFPPVHFPTCKSAYLFSLRIKFLSFLSFNQFFPLLMQSVREPETSDQWTVLWTLMGKLFFSLKNWTDKFKLPTVTIQFSIQVLRNWIVSNDWWYFHSHIS